MRKTKSKPQIGKREALKLAKEALENPLGVLEQIADKEEHAYSTINLGWSHNTSGLLWLCQLSFTGAMYNAKGAGNKPEEAIKIAILRAYDVGSEKDWQLRDKSFQEEA